METWIGPREPSVDVTIVSRPSLCLLVTSICCLIGRFQSYGGLVIEGVLLMSRQSNIRHEMKVCLLAVSRDPKPMDPLDICNGTTICLMPHKEISLHAALRSDLCSPGWGRPWYWSSIFVFFSCHWSHIANSVSSSLTLVLRSIPNPAWSLHSSPSWLCSFCTLKFEDIHSLH